MRIEIEIPEEFEVRFARDQFCESLHRLSFAAIKSRACGSEEQEFVDMLTESFKNAKPAFDTDSVVEQLEKKIQTHERCIEYEKKNGTITEEFQQRKAVEVLKDAIEIVKGDNTNGN